MEIVYWDNSRPLRTSSAFVASIAVSGVSLDQQTLELKIGETGTPVATVCTEDADDPRFTLYLPVILSLVCFSF